MSQNPNPDLVERFRQLSLPLESIPAGISPATQPIPGIRAILFDVYGTLLVSASGDIHAAKAADPAAAMQEALDACALAPEPGAGAAASAALEAEILRAHEALRERGVCYPEVEILAIWDAVVGALAIGGLIRREPPPAALPALAIEFECRVNPVWPMPGATETIASLRDRGIRLGIVSNAQFFTPIAIEALLGAAPETLGFEPPLTAWSYQHGEAKPSHGLFAGPLAQLERDSIRPGQTAFVGNDRLNDLLPAQELGIRPILFAGDRRSLRLREGDPRCANVREAAVITRLDQLTLSLA